MRDYAMIYRILCEDLRPFVRRRDHIGFACRQQLRCFYKKLSPRGDVGEKAEAAALEKFNAVNSQIPDVYSYDAESESDRRFWTNFKRIVYESTDWLWDDGAKNLTVEDLSEFLAVGPGANIEADSRNFYTKLFDSPMTATNPHVLARFRAALMRTGHWCAAEQARYQRFGDRIVSGNKLFFVPKNVEIARTACTEPLANSLVQQMLKGFLEYRLRRFFGIDLEIQQEYNKRLARIGSSNGTFGTIDLSSASDAISWSLVQQICSPSLIGWLADSRSPESILPDGSRVTLRMVSTMGNAFTFPLMTIIFSAVVRSVYYNAGYPCNSPRDHFCVFGDDIIVRHEAYDEVVRQLQKLGFAVNTAKSFNTGPFRESCGGDYWAGHNVRPVYIRSLETPATVYSAFNRLARWASSVGVNLNRTLACLRGLARERLIPLYESDDCGFKVPHFIALERLGTTRTYVGLAPRPLEFGVAESPAHADQLGYRDFNPDGWVVTALAGHARTRSVDGDWVAYLMGRRLPTVRVPYKVVRRRSHWWDWPGRHSYEAVSFDVWKYVVAAAFSVS